MFGAHAKQPRLPQREELAADDILIAFYSLNTERIEFINTVPCWSRHIFTIAVSYRCRASILLVNNLYCLYSIRFYCYHTHCRDRADFIDELVNRYSAQYTKALSYLYAGHISSFHIDAKYNFTPLILIIAIRYRPSISAHGLRSSRSFDNIRRIRACPPQRRHDIFELDIFIHFLPFTPFLFHVWWFFLLFLYFTPSLKIQGGKARRDCATAYKKSANYFTITRIFIHGRLYSPHASSMHDMLKSASLRTGWFAPRLAHCLPYTMMMAFWWARRFIEKMSISRRYGLSGSWLMIRWRRRRSKVLPAWLHVRFGLAPCIQCRAILPPMASRHFKERQCSKASYGE